MERTQRPVHLYVKTHLVTGTKYFGRTSNNPHTYRGSGTYWLRHIEQYGYDVHTEIVGTYYDQETLRIDALRFSEEHQIDTSPQWANLLKEDGGINGHGWRPYRKYTPQVDALDSAVEWRLLNNVEHTPTISARLPPHQDSLSLQLQTNQLQHEAAKNLGSSNGSSLPCENRPASSRQRPSAWRRFKRRWIWWVAGILLLDSLVWLLRGLPH